MNATDAPSLRIMDDQRLGAALRALWESTSWCGVEIRYSFLHDGEALVSVRHLESGKEWLGEDLDAALRAAARP